MVKDYIVSILVNRITSKWVYPKTGKPLTSNDILKEEYRTAVESIVSSS